MAGLIPYFHMKSTPAMGYVLEGNACVSAGQDGGTGLHNCLGKRHKAKEWCLPREISSGKSQGEERFLVGSSKE